MRDRYLYDLMDKENEKCHQRLDKAFKRKVIMTSWAVVGMIVGLMILFNIWAVIRVMTLR